MLNVFKQSGTGLRPPPALPPLSCLPLLLPAHYCCYHVPSPRPPGLFPSGYQALLLAPTELLASQHFSTLSFISEQLPLADRPRVELLTSSMPAKVKDDVKRRIAAGGVDLVVSTQAALWVKKWGKLALLVVDEQHK